jgi:ribosomal protein S18 acetylase RimI-like enzyme
MNRCPVQFRRVNRADDPSLLHVVEIYQASIPVSERKPSAWISAAVLRSDFVLLVAERAGPGVVGFSLTYQPADEPMALLEYLAIDGALRGQGIGSVLFAATRQLLGERSLLVEVEAAEHPSLDCDAARRQRFYRRLGCRRIGNLRYQLPLNTSPPPPAMDLMLAGAAAPLRRAELARWLGLIYTDVYNQPADDPRLALMIAPLPEILGLD